MARKARLNLRMFETEINILVKVVTHMTNFDPSRAKLSKKDTFPRFRVKNSEPLEKLVQEKKIKSTDEILVLERNGYYLAFSIYQMAYHHVAQGELAGNPYLVAF